eukprot:SAG31_NODE_1771_length_7309_cov_4.269626_6_plen_58_part_00
MFIINVLKCVLLVLVARILLVRGRIVSLSARGTADGWPPRATRHPTRGAGTHPRWGR